MNYNAEKRLGLKKLFLH